MKPGNHHPFSIRRSFSCLFVVSLCMTVAAANAAGEPDPEAMLREASKHVATRDAVQADMAMDMEFKDGTREINAGITGSFILGADNKAHISLKAGDQAVLVYNNENERYLYFPDENKYRKLPPERDRRVLFRSALSGPLETSFIWLADFLHGDALLSEETVTHAGLEEVNGASCHVLELSAPNHSLRVYLTADAPQLLRRFVLDMRDAALRVYSPSPSASLRVTANFDNWRLDAPIHDAMFAFAPPADAQPVQDAPERPEDKQIGAEAPDFELPLLGGGAMKLSAHRGQDIVILDFWASWCGPCRSAMPIVVRVADSFKDSNVVLYAVNLRETEDKARAFLERSKLTVKAPLDSTGEVANRYGVTGIPRLILIDKKGIIRAVHAGMSPSLERQLTEEIKALL